MVKRKQDGFKLEKQSKKKSKVSSEGRSTRAAASETSFVTLGADCKDEDELSLEERVFGGVAGVIDRLASDVESDHDEASQSELRPAWQDEDDDISAKAAFRAQGRRASAVEKAAGGYSKMLRSKFESVVGTPKWADLNRKEEGSDSDAESDDEVLQRCGRFVVRKGSVLSKGIIEIKRLKDLNVQTYAEGPIIKATQFHPSATVGLVAGLAGTASLFQVDGQNNTKLQSVQLERFPITCARFTRDGNQFLVGSPRHRHLYCHDLLSGKTSRVLYSAPSAITNMKSFEVSPDGRLMAACGRFGHVHVMTVRSQELVASLKMNGQVNAIAFSPDGSLLFAYGDVGEVYVWDMLSRSCLHRFVDDGCIKGCSLAVSPCGRLLACGSRSGIVNLYETADAMSSASPRPVKEFPNLTTAATALQFDSSSQLLAMASSEKDNAVKLAHVQSLTVYSNFPVSVAKVSRPQCLDFSLNSGFFVVGNNKNAALLYRLKSFGSY